MTLLCNFCSKFKLDTIHNCQNTKLYKVDLNGYNASDRLHLDVRDSKNDRLIVKGFNKTNNIVPAISPLSMVKTLHCQ